MALLIWIDIAGKTSFLAWLLCCQKSSPNSGLIVGQTRDEPEWVLLQLGRCAVQRVTHQCQGAAAAMMMVAM